MKTIVEAKRIYDEAKVIDLHCHPSLKVKIFGYNMWDDIHRLLFWKVKPTPKGNPWEMVCDFPKIVKGGVDSICASIYVVERGLIKNSSILSPAFWFLALLRSRIRFAVENIGKDSAFNKAKNQIEMMENQVKTAREKGFENVMYAHNYNELENGLNNKKICLLHTLEGAHMLGRNLENDDMYIERLKYFFEKGVCSITLSHFMENNICYPTEGISPKTKSKFKFKFNYDQFKEKGLTKTGEKIVREMLRLGMIVDLNHLNKKGREDVYRINHEFKRPLAFTHIGVEQFCNEPKCPTDEEIAMIAGCKGIIGIVAINYWLNKTENEKDDGIKNMIETILHIKKITGTYENIGIGTDFDGFGDPIDDLYSPEYLIKLTQAMLEAKIEEENIKKILGGNFLRVLKEGWGSNNVDSNYRSVSEYINLGRTVSENIWKKVKSDGITDKAENFFELAELKDSKPSNAVSSLFERFRNFLRWGLPWLRERVQAIFKGKSKFYTWEDTDFNGIYNINHDNEILIGITGDWGSDTIDACKVIDTIKGYSPDYTIHLGDTYYVGEYREIRNAFSDWCFGNKGSFALMGNHERMSGSFAYYNLIHNNLFKSSDMKFGCNVNGKLVAQNASYFCLETNKWRIIGLDTAYKDSIDLSKKCDLTNHQLDWLSNIVKVKDDKRGIIILTHHQYISSFEDESDYFTPAIQLSKIIDNEQFDRNIIWIWGHEHKFSIYGKFKCKGGVSAYGRCVGHGGMPIDLEKDNFNIDSGKNKPLILYDKRKRKMQGGYSLGYNGFALLKLKNEKLVIEYRDIENDLIVSETWVVADDGNISGDIILHKEETGIILVDNIKKGVNFSGNANEAKLGVSKNF